MKKIMGILNSKHSYKKLESSPPPPEYLDHFYESRSSAIIALKNAAYFVITYSEKTDLYNKQKKEYYDTFFRLSSILGHCLDYSDVLSAALMVYDPSSGETYYNPEMFKLLEKDNYPSEPPVEYVY